MAALALHGLVGSHNLLGMQHNAKIPSVDPLLSTVSCIVINKNEWGKVRFSTQMNPTTSEVEDLSLDTTPETARDISLGVPGRNNGLRFCSHFSLLLPCSL